jgi:hypothetical protein
MHTRSSLFLLALFIGAVRTSDLNLSSSSNSPLVKRTPDDGVIQPRAPAASPIDGDALNGLIEVRAPSDFDHIARSPTPVSAAEPDIEAEPELGLQEDPAPAPEAAAKPVLLELNDDDPLLEYEGAEVLQKRANCPA